MFFYHSTFLSSCYTFEMINMSILWICLIRRICFMKTMLSFDCTGN
uniref:Uncharacterized protein n=1 Tax=Arundo donax TaxID=35708 RepID=A0A0A9TFF2_ARUDO